MTTSSTPTIAEQVTELQSAASGRLPAGAEVRRVDRPAAWMMEAVNVLCTVIWWADR